MRAAQRLSRGGVGEMGIMLPTSKVLIIFMFIKFITWAFKVSKTLLIKDQVPGSGVLLSRCSRPPHCTVTSVHSLLIYSVNQLAQPSQQRQNLVTATVYTTSPPAAAAFPSCSPHTARAIRIRTSPRVAVFQRHLPLTQSPEKSPPNPT